MGDKTTGKARTRQQQKVKKPRITFRKFKLISVGLPRCALAVGVRLGPDFKSGLGLRLRVRVRVRVSLSFFLALDGVNLKA
jgi:hypothetical protein